jgi:hypothetical protein
MKALALDYLVNDAGKRTAAVVPMRAWRKALEAMEELDDIRAYDRAKRRKSDPLPLEQALTQITGRKAR